jgi:hypothetical protein
MSEAPPAQPGPHTPPAPSETRDANTVANLAEAVASVAGVGVAAWGVLKQGQGSAPQTPPPPNQTPPPPKDDEPTTWRLSAQSAASSTETGPFAMDPSPPTFGDYSTR